MSGLAEQRKMYEEVIKKLENELEYVRTIKDSAEKTLKEVREENRKLK
jgi:RNA polymerase-interacting CarD/CdnL/TRCF family regulator